ncbi:hypothetical protein [Larkinella rosea]|uniref:Secretion system C-terminal sorting domain-containing protein n=1 Tax=Larkinella rosea TaxID=2025312 RepID=A0A3P1BS51_9BACT|nr:hypothetical protein [Larkinella rosea]RRB03935.1 hypothetical protein EHT25_10400 [Larkinella rosea]
MKTLRQFLLVATTLTFASASFAATNPDSGSKAKHTVATYQTSLYTDAQGKLRIAVDKETGGVVEVRLVNQAGKEFFVQEVGKHQKIARLSLDVNSLPDDAYQVTVSNGVDTKVNNLTLATQQPRVPGRLIAVN